MVKKAAPPVSRAKTLERISIVENMFNPGVGLFVESILKSGNSTSIETRVVDSAEILRNVRDFHPDVVILDVDSLRFAESLTIALAIRDLVENQVVIFLSERINPAVVNEGMVAPLWTRAYWINQPSRNPALILPEITRAFSQSQPVSSSVLETAIHDGIQFGLLSPQQHRVMRLLAMGASNSAIAQECKLTIKAVERTIATASKLLGVEPASLHTNRRVNAATKYLKLMFFADSTQPFIEK